MGSFAILQTNLETGELIGLCALSPPQLICGQRSKSGRGIWGVHVTHASAPLGIVCQQQKKTCVSVHGLTPARPLQRAAVSVALPRSALQAARI